MNLRTAALAVIISLLALSLPLMSDDASADAGVDKEVYCYGDNPTFSYELSSNVTVSWRVYDSDGEAIDFTVIDERSMTVDLEGIGEDVYVEQTVTGGGITDTQIMLVHPMHVIEDEDGQFTINFWDGDELLNTQVIHGGTHVMAGDDFFFVPDAPEKEGFNFIGWYLDTSLTDTYVDSKSPVTDDLDFHARWGSTSGGGTHTVTIHDTHLVTFEMVNGLRYDIVSVGGVEVRFRVSVADGYVFDMSTVTVSANTGTLTQEDGVYILDGIRADTVVTISGSQMFSVDYRLGNVSVSVPGYDTLPGTTIAGSFDMDVEAPFGWSGLDVTVLMDGKDVTAECVYGGAIHIGKVTGDLVIIADSSIPWLYILIAVIVIAAVLAVFVLHRRRAYGRDRSAHP